MIEICIYSLIKILSKLRKTLQYKVKYFHAIVVDQHFYISYAQSTRLSKNYFHFSIFQRRSNGLPQKLFLFSLT